MKRTLIEWNKDMKVGFDISQLAHPGGVATYTKNIATQLAKIKDLQMTFFYSSLRKNYTGDLPNVRRFKIPPTIFEILFNNFRLIPIEKFIGEVDVFHSSDWVQPPTKAKKITTYHDLIPVKFPNWSSPKAVAVHKKRLKIVENEIDMIIVVSESTKKDLLELSSIPEKKIVVIYEGVSKEFRPQDKTLIEEFKRKYKLPDRFVLAVEGIGERKNLKRIEEACKDYKLVVLGETVKNLTFGELPLLYSSADMLLYGSLYEGFGLPILEAFACGCPVITSNTSSMPEVGGRAALYMNPMNVEDIRGKVKLLMEDNDLRSELIKKGFNQAKKFSWEKAAQETAEVYSKLFLK